MSNCFDYNCPKCGDADHIDVEATLWVRLTYDGTDADESENGDHTWDDDSGATCTNCGFDGKVRDFDPEQRKRKRKR